MTQRILLPVYRVDIAFVVRHGRSWSSLEHLILWACTEPSSAEDLSRCSSMPLRLVSECLVNLLRVGWVELRERPSGTMFAATAAGRAEAAKPVPDRHAETQPRSGQVYMERLTGAFFATWELEVVRSGAAEFRAEDALPPRLYRTAPFGPEIAGMLPMRKDDTFDRLREVRSVPGDLFAVLEAGPAGLAGLPARTSASVGLAVLDELRTAGRATEGEERLDVEAALGAPLADRQLSKRIAFGPDTLVLGGPEHLAAAEQLVSRARKLVVVHSTFVGGNIEKLLPALRDAAAAGVQVHVHWGRSDDPEGLVPNPAEMSARLARSNVPDEHRGNFHVGSRSTGSHAKILLADTGAPGGILRDRGLLQLAGLPLPQRGGLCQAVRCRGCRRRSRPARGDARARHRRGTRGEPPSPSPRRLRGSAPAAVPTLGDARRRRGPLRRGARRYA